jgi:cell wall-associated NlpC family hydrolase
MTKNLIGALFVVGSLASCGAVKTIQNNPLRGQDAKFIDDITYVPKQVTTTQTFSGSKSVGGPNVEKYKPSPEVADVKEEIAETPKVSTSVSALQTKYAAMLKVSPSEITDIALYKSISNWYGTRYNYGGTSHRGVDCSSLMQHLNTESWGRSIPRTAFLQYRATPRISRDELQEGDLIFFNTTGGVSHVGMYLKNDMFVHASSSKGVTISSLNEKYYTSRYIGAGRFK